LGALVARNQNESSGEMIARGGAQNRAALRKGNGVSKGQPRRNEENDDGRRSRHQESGGSRLSTLNFRSSILFVSSRLVFISAASHQFLGLILRGDEDGCD
jgi:hypothetical protein